MLLDSNNFAVHPWESRIVSFRAASWSLALMLLFSQSVRAAEPRDPALEKAHKLLASTILIDGHNDLPWAIRTHPEFPQDVARYDLRTQAAGQTDLPRLKQGRIGGQFWSVFVPGEMSSGWARTQLEQFDIARRMIAQYPEALQYVDSAAGIRKAKRAGKIASIIGMEGGHVIENSLGALRMYYELGARYMTLTHNVHTDWADSAAQPPVHGGLTPFGEEVVLEMNRLGMLVDLSHVSEGTMDDALRVSKAPVIFSHSSARAICDVPRNVPDDILRRLPANGGVVMVTFVAGFIDPEIAKVEAAMRDEVRSLTKDVTESSERRRIAEQVRSKYSMPKTTIAKVADHIEHIRNVAGIEHVGIGGDYDGNDLWPENLHDVSKYPYLFAELIRRGWTDKELKMLAGENVLRVFEEAEKVAKKLRTKN
jgi:membrane dipeptidase